MERRSFVRFYSLQDHPNGNIKSLAVSFWGDFRSLYSLSELQRVTLNIIFLESSTIGGIKHLYLDSMTLIWIKKYASPISMTKR